MVKDDSGKPVAGAIAVAAGVGTSSHQSHLATTTASGANSSTGLEPGRYLVCVQTPGGPNLDPCQWSKPTPIAVSSGATTANQSTTAVKGARLEVRIDDPLKLLETGKGGSGGDIIVGVLLPQALLQPMRLASSDSTGRAQIHSTHVQIADNQGTSLASASTQTVQAPAGTGTQVLTFSVTGKK